MTKFEPKKYYIQTFGCAANVADSNTIVGVLEALGFEPATSINSLTEKDLFIVNTCSVRQKSEDKVYGLGKNFVGQSARSKKKKKPFVVMAGCMVGSVTGERQRYEFAELKNRTPWVDDYINPAQIMELPTILQEHDMLDEWALKKFNAEEVHPGMEDTKHAFVNISYGCDNFCTFCVVPYARGKEVSRSENEILREINHFAVRGITEITLCGQNVNSWGLNMVDKFAIRTGSSHKLPFAGLLRKIHEITEIEKIDFISSNPFDFTQDLIETIKLPKISNYMHIAVQSGNNAMLSKMNRRHTIEDFYSLVSKITEAKPKVELGTDIIVGFPGETEEQFMDTVELVKKVKFKVAFIAMYSPRKGTPAERFYPDDIPLAEKRRRHAYLTRVWKDSLKPKTTKNSSGTKKRKGDSKK